MTDAPVWPPSEDPEFDTVMASACADLLRRLETEPDLRANVLADPRTAHRLLYARFTPAGLADYAGVYRGTPGTSVESRTILGPSVITPGKDFKFMAVEAVPAAMTALLQDAASLRAQAATLHGQLLALAYPFAQLGAIHPFLDGNGHIQRVLFAAGALEMGIPLSRRFALHPRSYDFLLALVLESFTRSQADEVRGRYLGGIAEYLAQWLGGPFDAPGSGLAPLDAD